MSACLLCKTDNVETVPALTGEFLAERISSCERETTLIHCRECGFAYFSKRLSNEECEKLYSGYRNADYQKQRQKYDIWYSAEINELIGKNQKEIKNRNKNLTEILKKHTNLSEIESVLDFGGDTGVFIPEELSAAKYVYDISGIETVDGVIALSKDELNDRKFDFVMCCHVLEHVANPFEIIDDIKKYLKNDGYFYLELPFDSPFYKNNLSYFDFLFNKYFSLRILFLQFFKNLKLKKPLMSEHINYFTQKSTEKMLLGLGFEILESKITKIDCEWNKQNIISVFARFC